MEDHMTTVEPTWFARLFGQVRVDYRKAEIRPEGIAVDFPNEPVTLYYDSITDVIPTYKLLWSEIRINDVTGKGIILSGLPRRIVQDLHDRILQGREKFQKILELIRNYSTEIESLSLWIDDKLRGEYWVAHHELETVISQINVLGPVLIMETEHLPILHTTKQAIKKIRTLSQEPEKFQHICNERFIPDELDRFQDYFDTVETNPLTESQRKAIITHEDNTRVIAGAGSGKTSVIVAKAGYLLKKGLCKPNEILLLAFNRSAATDMSARIQQLIGLDLQATTFHALGLGIIAESENKKPSLAKSAQDDKLLKRQVQAILTELVKDPKTANPVRNYFQSFFAPYHSKFEFEKLGDYYAYLKKNDLVTLEGETVKSYEEAEIANFLCLNGITYEYERHYQVNTATITHRQYEPDFYLSDYGIYIEHFGIRRDGSTPPFINRSEYTAGMEWKRQVHRQNNTKLIETYSYQKSEGNLFTELKKKLRENGVVFQPVMPEKALEKLNAANRIDPFSQLATTFLNHFKGGCHTFDGIREHARGRDLLDDRLEAFLTVFNLFLERYEAALQETSTVDFNDMINRASEHVEAQRYISPYTCILVDEFQDISTGRARLIKGLSDQVSSHRLFCVGDDWQAIYRFAGSDIALMRNFDKHFGFTETVALDHTFRFNDRIEAVATKFVLANPAQIKKIILTKQKASTPQVIIHRQEGKKQNILIEVLNEIPQQASSKPSKVLVLSRYNYLRDGLAWSEISSLFPKLEIAFQTIHGAKGLEADYVVILGMKSGKHGFPSEITDDPILEVVLSEPEGFNHAEERRLFYVALTRARHAVHLIADYANPSAFLTEIMAYGENIEARGAAATEPVNCPTCKTGTLVQRTGPHSPFYSCTNYPLCGYKIEPCRHCGTGLLVKNESKGIYTCNNTNCVHTERACPKCVTGRLVEKGGKYGPFLGCTNFSKASCKYTENLHSLTAKEG